MKLIASELHVTSLSERTDVVVADECIMSLRDI